MSVRLRRCVVVALLALVALTGCDGGSPLTRTQVRRSVLLSSGPDGGVASAWGQELGREFRAQSTSYELIPETSSGTVANLRRLTLGSADLALTTADAIEPDEGDACVQRTAAGAGDQRRVPLVALGRIYDDYLQIATRADSPLRSVADLAGRPVAVGTTGSGTALATCRVLDSAGVTVDQVALDADEGLRALQADEVDAVFWLGEQPSSPAAAQNTLRFISLGPLAAQVARRYNSVYRRAAMSAGAGGDATGVTTIATSVLLIGRADVDDRVVDDVLRVVFGRRDEMAVRVPAAVATDRRTAVFTGALNLHPAAQRYYRQVKP